MKLNVIQKPLKRYTFLQMVTPILNHLYIQNKALSRISYSNISNIFNKNKICQIYSQTIPSWTTWPNPSPCNFSEGPEMYIFRGITEPNMSRSEISSSEEKKSLSTQRRGGKTIIRNSTKSSDEVRKLEDLFIHVGNKASRQVGVSSL